MQLVTKQFGGIDFEASDIIVFESGICEFARNRQWLLIADACDDHLYWLQSISNTDIAVPVLCSEGLPFDYQLSLTEREFKLDTSNLIAMVPVDEIDGTLSVDLHLPILIHKDSGQGLQLRNERYQPMQRLSSVPPTLLRQSA